MEKRKLCFIASLIVTLSVITLLVTGSSLLSITLDKNNSLPLGNLITWAGMVSLPLTIYWGIGEMRNPTGLLNTILSRILKLALLLAVLWFPISFLLAGNLTFSFSEKETFRGSQLAMKWFWGLSYGIGLGALLSLVVFGISFIFKKIKS